MTSSARRDSRVTRVRALLSSAGRMEQAADGFGWREFVVKRNGKNLGLDSEPMQIAYDGMKVRI
jgi:hypothetical protein